MMLAWLLTSHVLAMPAQGYERCVAQANNDLEQLYCQVVSAGQGSGLPAMDDFQRNDPRMQALLLQRPARRLGLDLPAAPEPVDEPPLSSASEQATESSSPEAPREESPVAGNALSGCQLHGEVIQCPQGRFQRVGNQPNHALADGVLGDDWQMGLPRFSGDLQDDEALQRYLAKAYDVYISKMLSIGLAGNTMSFTGFVHGFRRHQAQGVNYAERMEATFQLLKQDKKTHAIPRHFHKRLPDSMDACMEAGADIIVCDNVHTNWVYLRQSGEY